MALVDMGGPPTFLAILGPSGDMQILFVLVCAFLHIEFVLADLPSYDSGPNSLPVYYLGCAPGLLDHFMHQFWSVLWV